MSAMRLPLTPPEEWWVVSPTNPAAVEMANRHYSRRDPTARRIGGPWKKLALVTADGSALWLSGYSTQPMDGLDAARCHIFRNEGTHVASSLIRSAMDLTYEEWHDLDPADGWVTWVDAAKVESQNPGYCFLRAGWWRDREWHSSRRASMLRFRAEWTPRGTP